MMFGIHTHDEIEQQSQTWDLVLKNFSQSDGRWSSDLQASGKRTWLVTGCGSTYYASLSTAAVMRRLGLNAWGFPASEIVYFPDWENDR